MVNIQFETSNAAFEDDKNFEIAEILREVSEKIESGFEKGKIRDVNGNTVGSYFVD